MTLVAYTATALTMAISADQSVVALANIFMTITFVFMMVRDAAAAQAHVETQGYMFEGAGGSSPKRVHGEPKRLMQSGQIGIVE